MISQNNDVQVIVELSPFEYSRISLLEIPFRHGIFVLKRLHENI